MFTEKQERLLNKCIKAGWGWRKFAQSVKDQGWCSQRQENTLIRMSQRLDTQIALISGNFRHSIDNCTGDVGISEEEAMRSHDYY